jgi:HEAT repeat protein
MNQALLDKNSSIRSLAQDWLIRTRQVDVAQNYRNRLSIATGTGLRVMIEGLGEVGRPEDSMLILPFTTHRIVRTRISAIRAIARLNRSAYADTFLNLLTDDSAKVSRVSCNILGIKPYIIGLEQIWNVFKTDEMIHVRLNALSLLAKYPKWDIIPYLIYASCDIDETIRLNAFVFLNKWLIRSTFVKPTSQQMECLNQALSECSAKIPEPILLRLQFAFRNL